MSLSKLTNTANLSCVCETELRYQNTGQEYRFGKDIRDILIYYSCLNIGNYWDGAAIDYSVFMSKLSTQQIDPACARYLS